MLVKQVWADPRTRLPTRIRERLPVTSRKNNQYTIGKYEFPSTGPSSIYDLGVPRDIPIVDANKTNSLAVQAIMDAGRQAKQSFPQHFRAVVWPEKNGRTIYVIYRSGTKIRAMWYAIIDIPEYDLSLPATVEGVMHWTETQKPTHIDNRCDLGGRYTIERDHERR